MYTKAEGFYSKTRLTNLFNSKVARRGTDNQKGYTLKVQQKSKIKEIELYVRNEVLTTTELPTTRNMVNGYDDITFNEDNKLQIIGYSYDIGGLYDNKDSITRKILLENQTTYNQTEYDTEVSTGPFKIETLDGKDKTYAWY